jgi:LAS superfamily LD-carboxypeptidase LdcB
MGHQQELCNAQAACSSGDHSTIAKPGTSNHQLGLAIDFSHGGKGGSSANCINAGGKCTLNGDATWEWLDENAQNFGIKQLSNEFWHWSPLEN